MIELENIEKHEHYEVPENYFEELPGRVMQRIKHEQHRRRNIISGAVAAVAILAIAVGMFFTLNTADKRTDIAQTQTSATFETDDEVLESLASEYYSEELAMMDYYQYYEY